MRIRQARRSLLVAVASACIVAACAAEAPTVDGTATLTSDYVFRGISQADGVPAAQVGFQVTWKTGVYFAPWASTVDFGPDYEDRFELDLSAGWSGEVGKGWTLDVNVTRYAFPGAQELDSTDLNVTAVRKERLVLSVSPSDDALASGQAGAWLEVGGRWRPHPHVAIEVTGGHYLLPALPHDGYSALRLEVTFPWIHVAPRLDVHVPSGAARDAFGDTGEARVEIAVDFSF